MKFVCDNCSTQYLISDDKVTPRGVKVRCKRCGNIIMVQASQPAGEPTDRTLTKQAPPGGTEPDAGPPLGSADSPAAEDRDELGQAFDQLLKDGLPPDDSGEEGEDEGQETAVLSMEEIERQRLRKKGIERDKIDRVFDNLGSSQVPGEPSSPGGAEEWYVAIRDQQVGPLALAEVERRFAAGELNSESLAWQSGMGDWQPIRDIPRLRYLIGSGGARAGEEKKDVPTAVSKPSEAPAQQWAPVQESSLSSLVEDELAQVKSKPPPAAPVSAAVPVAGEPEDGELAPWEKEEVVSGEVARPPESFFDSSLDRKVPGTGSRYFEDTRHSQVIAGPAYLGGGRGKSSSKVLALSVIAGLVIVVGGGAAFLLLSNHNTDPNPGPVPMPPPQAEAGPVAAGGPDAGLPAPAVDAGVAEAVDAGQGTGPEGGDGGREVVVVAPGQNNKPDGAGKNPKPGEGKKPRPGGTTVAVKTPKTPDRSSGEPKLPKPPDKSAGGDEGLGPMTKETVMGTLRAYQRAMKGCVEQQLQRDPTVTGTLVVGFVIQNSGKVNEVNVLSEEHRGTFVAICISQVIKGIGFPKFSGPPFEVPRMPLRLGG